MRRREFITLVGGVAVGWPLSVHAQQPAKAHRVAFIATTSPVSELAGDNPINPAARAFVQGLRALGYVEGKNLVLEWRSAEGRQERYPEIIRQLVSINVDVIVTVVNNMTLAAKEVTRTVPIVMAAGSNPVELGLVQSLARPGGNVTGLCTDIGFEIYQKLLQFLRELLPTMSRMAFLWPRSLLHHEEVRRVEGALEPAARSLGLSVVLAEFKPTDYTQAFALIVRERPDALLVPLGGANYANRHLIVEFAAKSRLPAMYMFREAVTAGGLISYGASIPDLFRRAGAYVDKILKGAKPADLPVEQPTKFELVINAKTAKALGLTVPALLLARADEVIE